MEAKLDLRHKSFFAYSTPLGADDAGKIHQMCV